jgi:hypothetical protein
VLGGSLGANAINFDLLNVYSQMFLGHKDWYITNNKKGNKQCYK